MMRIDIITIFPEMFREVFSSGTVKIARDKKLLDIAVHNLRDYTDNKHKKVDASPYGGGPGMVLQCQPIFRAVEKVKKLYSKSGKNIRTVLLSPQGKALTQKEGRRLVKKKHLILICGRYEGVDERVREHLVDEEISIGDYILSGGEIPAMVLVDCLARLIPGVPGNPDSVKDESFEKRLLDYPDYTKPGIFKGWRVPSVLLSGNHKRIKDWREKQALQRTMVRRPDLLLKDKRGQTPVTEGRRGRNTKS